MVPSDDGNVTPAHQSDWFGMVTGDVAFDPNLSATAKAVYLVLVMYRNADTNECFPSNKRIAAAIGATTRTAIRALDELAEARVILRIPRFQDGRQISSLTVLADAASKRGGGRR